MLLTVSVSLLALPLAAVIAKPAARSTPAAPVNVTTCNGKTYSYSGLAGYGKLASDARDKFGDTIGGIGSAIALDKKSWKSKKGKKEAYTGVVYGLPDRGWNTEGTQNTQSRIHKFGFEFEVVEATVEKPAGPNFRLEYLDTLLLAGPDGAPLTGLDPTTTVTYKGFPSLPLAECKMSGLFSVLVLTLLKMLAMVSATMERAVLAFPSILKGWFWVTTVPSGSAMSMRRMSTSLTRRAR